MGTNPFWVQNNREMGEIEMKIAVLGSRSLMMDVDKYIPEETTEIITGGTRGISKRVERWADKHKVPKLIFKQDYKRNASAACILANEAIVECADFIVAIWDGKSEGTAHAISYARQVGKPIRVILIGADGEELEIKEYRY